VGRKIKFYSVSIIFVIANFKLTQMMNNNTLIFKKIFFTFLFTLFFSTSAFGVVLTKTYQNNNAQNGEVFLTYEATELFPSENVLYVALTDDYGGALAVQQVSPTIFNIIMVNRSALPNSIIVAPYGETDYGEVFTPLPLDVTFIKYSDIQIENLGTDTPCEYKGQTFTLSYKVTNNGPENAIDIQASLAPPVDNNTFQFVSYTSTSGLYNSATGKWDITTLASGESTTIVITYLMGNFPGNIQFNGSSNVTGGSNTDDTNTSNNYVDMSSVFVTPLDNIVLNNDTVTNATAGTTNVINVLTNDSVDGNSPAEIVIGRTNLTTVSESTPGALTLNPDGSIDVATGLSVGTYTLTYSYCHYTPYTLAYRTANNPKNKNANDCIDCKEATVSVTIYSDICHELPTDTSTSVPTNHGITVLGRAGEDNGNWPMVRNSAYTVLEGKTKGFVITRNANPEGTITNPVVGMIVFDTDENAGKGCLKIYVGSGIGEGWKCFNTQGCPYKSGGVINIGSKVK